jgi:hypothetical protein
VAQKGRGQGFSAKSAHAAGIQHQSQEYVANHVEVLSHPLKEMEGKASVLVRGGQEVKGVLTTTSHQSQDEVTSVRSICRIPEDPKVQGPLVRFSKRQGKSLKE